MGILNKTSSIVLPFNFIIDHMPVKKIYTSKFLRGYCEYNLNWYDYVDSISNNTVEQLTCTRFLDFRDQYSPLYITFQYILMKEENKIIMIESNEMKI